MPPDAPLLLHRIPGPAPAPDAPLAPFWSVTKTVIALCALRLAEQRRLDLDAPLADIGVTLRQLLGHTAGLPGYFTLPAY
uniref:serine hydrolase n=1 Tax=Pararhodobacter aggregans TaxID=404875 RepID=UPI003A8DDA00